MGNGVLPLTILLLLVFSLQDSSLSGGGCSDRSGWFLKVVRKNMRRKGRGRRDGNVVDEGEASVVDDDKELVEVMDGQLLPLASGQTGEDELEVIDT